MDIMKSFIRSWAMMLVASELFCNSMRETQLVGSNLKYQSSPVESFKIRNRTILVKRDDKYILEPSGVSGNKARKFYALNELDAEKIPDEFISYGGCQSNSMLAISLIAKSKSKSFTYYTKSLGKLFHERGWSGNLRVASENGMRLIELSNEKYSNYFHNEKAVVSPPKLICPEDFLWIPQGGANSDADEGVRILAEEIKEYWQTATERIKKSTDLLVLVPSGTGTTAAFLSKHLWSASIRVAALPCVGGKDYLKSQIVRVLSYDSTREPLILDDMKKYPFGKPRTSLLNIWKELRSHGLCIDLLYGVRAWEIIFHHIDQFHPDTVCMYVHSGGLEGVESQLARSMIFSIVSSLIEPPFGGVFFSSDRTNPDV